MEACVLLSKTMVLQTCIYTTQSQHMSPQIAWVLARVSNKHIVHEEGTTSTQLIAHIILYASSSSS